MFRAKWVLKGGALGLHYNKQSVGVTVRALMIVKSSRVPWFGG